MKLTAAGKVVILLIVIGLAALGWNYLQGSDLMAKLAPGARTKESVVPATADLPTIDGAPATVPVASTSFAAPGSAPGCEDRPEVRFLLWAWNAQMGMMLANGGPQATEGSLMCRRGINLKFIRQDDPGKMQEELVAFATELSRGVEHPKKGAHFVAIMGDG